jgi:hypothetical protein
MQFEGLIATPYNDIIWKAWAPPKERNAMIFQHHAMPSNVVIDKIKVDARIWSVAEAKHLSNVILGE